MKIAFYAPMKPPDHDTPSGDREIARGLVRAFALAGHDVALASRLCTFDRDGDARVQHDHRTRGEREAAAIVARHADGADLWFTYHLHHKAPDCVGPIVARALSIPYVVAEASIAPKQANGAWSAGYALAHDAICDADAIVHLNPADVPEVRRARGEHHLDLVLAPFVDAAACARPRRTHRDLVRLVTVAMMRDGAKLASYRMLGRALAPLRGVRFSLSVVGDGQARSAVDAALAPLGERVTRLGALPQAGVIAALHDADVFVWPAIDEAIGVALLEAQACGLPVVAGRSPGVATIVDHGRTGLLTPVGDDAAFARAVRLLIVDAALRERMAHAAATRALAHHDIGTAAARLDVLLRAVVSAGRRAARPPRPAPFPALP